MISRTYLKAFPKKMYEFLKKSPSIKLHKARYRGKYEYYTMNTTDPSLCAQRNTMASSSLKPEYCRIWLDYREDILPTLIHEFLHYDHPEWSESKVENAERIIANSIGPIQAKRILKALVKIL